MPRPARIAGFKLTEIETYCEENSSTLADFNMMLVCDTNVAFEVLMELAPCLEEIRKSWKVLIIITEMTFGELVNMNFTVADIKQNFVTVHSHTDIRKKGKSFALFAQMTEKPQKWINVSNVDQFKKIHYNQHDACILHAHITTLHNMPSMHAPVCAYATCMLYTLNICFSVF